MGKRQEVLGQNIANADTPDYRARDVKDSQFKAMLQARTRPVKLATTDVKHVAAPGAASLSTSSQGVPNQQFARDFRSEKVKPEGDVGPTGNTVDVEEQAVKVAEVGAEYALMTSLYRKHVNMIRIALGRGGR